MPTLNDIADVVGVSTMTVSRALAGQPGVSEAMRERIKAAAAQIGYGGNAAASALARGRTNTIGVLTQRVSNDYTSGIVQGIAEVFETTTDYDLVIYSPHHGIDNPGQYLLSHSHGLTDGLLLVSSTFSMHAEAEAGALCRQGFPLVMIDASPSDRSVPHVVANNEQGGFDVTRYLIEIGHRRIGFIGAGNAHQSRERYKGYRRALAEYRIRFDKAWEKEGGFSFVEANRRMREWIDAGQWPTAVFCASDNMALGALDACKAAGVDVPGDVSIAGFDDIFSASSSSPALTTVRQSLHEMGRAGAQMLLGLLKGKEVERTVRLQTSLILRDSCKPYRNGK
jgi:DNA-binding LacI/PurR family transcriptional regulator